VDPLLKRHHFGHKGGHDATICFSLGQQIPVFSSRNEERSEKLTRCSALTLRELITDGKLESSKRESLRKPIYLFGDAMEADDNIVFDGNYKWLRKIGDRLFFLPNMAHMVPLSYLQSVSIRRQMDWDLTRELDGVTIGRITRHGAQRAGHGRSIDGMYPGLVGESYPQSETQKLANLFISRFLKAKGEFPASGFRTYG